jgi:hypothetical protein
MAAAARSKLAASQHVQDMAATLAKMHALLKSMKARASAASKDSVAKANLEMWSLMLDQLDKEYGQLVASTKAREDLETRRQAMYKQADAKAALEAQAAKSAAANKAAAPAQPTEPAASAPAPVQPAATPNAPVTSPN